LFVLPHTVNTDALVVPPAALLPPSPAQLCCLWATVSPLVHSSRSSSVLLVPLCSSFYVATSLFCATLLLTGGQRYKGVAGYGALSRSGASGVGSLRPGGVSAELGRSDGAATLRKVGRGKAARVGAKGSSDRGAPRGARGLVSERWDARTEIFGSMVGGWELGGGCSDFGGARTNRKTAEGSNEGGSDSVESRKGLCARTQGMEATGGSDGNCKATRQSGQSVGQAKRQLSDRRNAPTCLTGSVYFCVCGKGGESRSSKAKQGGAHGARTSRSGLRRN
jgi:hypothetical protein